MMKKVICKPAAALLCAVLALSVCLTGCQFSGRFPVAVSDTTRSALELCSDSYKDGKLDNIYAEVRGGIKLSDLNAEYPIECLRQDEEGYHIIYQGNTRVLVLRFDNDASWIEADRLHSIFRLTETRGKFDALQEGDPVTEVQKRDPTCYFPFLTDRDSDDLVSHHYTEDGYHTTIRYRPDGTIASVRSEMM